MSRKYVLSILLFLLVMPVCLLYGISDSLSQAVTKLPADSNHSLLRRTYCERIIADTVNASFKEKVVAYDSLMTWSLAGGDSVAYYKYLFGKGETLKEQGNMHASYNNYKRLAYELSMKKELVPELEQIKRKAFMEMPGFLLRLNRIDESLDFSYNLLKTYPDMSLNEKIKIYSSIAGGYISVDQKLCLTYINKMKAIVDSVGGQHLYGTYYNLKAGYMLYENNIDSAVYYLDKAIVCTPERKYNIELASMYMNYVHICFHLEDMDMAMLYLNRILRDIPSHVCSFIRSVALIDKASLLYVLGREQESIDCYYECIEYSRFIGDKRIEYKAMMLVGERLQKQGQRIKGLDMVVEAYHLKDSLDKQEASDNIYWLSKDFELYRAEAGQKLDDSLQESRRLSEKYRNVTTVLVVFGIFVILMAIVLLVSHKLRLYKARNEQISRELETHQKQSQQDISMKDDRIMSGMIQGMKKNDALKSMRDGLRRLKHTDDVKEKNAICSELDAILKSCEIYDDMNEEVRLQFEVAHPHFTENLRNACPQLTDREVYICTLLASGMSAKEIARVSSYTIRSVETIIYRLRKKLQLPTEVKTQDYLQQFC